ncbi:hypothetical protein DPMN_185571 [Dreissena polymorpha]|uniref:Uncharacterized protein n=1 Tax=Dreissena polymorpha TaxID=45954 RepID=A0A9D4I7E8_DREPO|nr:hypothetical protein DPMN_185571 [Dreissena polymorpha]
MADEAMMMADEAIADGRHMGAHLFLFFQGSSANSFQGSSATSVGGDNNTMVQCAAFGCNARLENWKKGFFCFPAGDSIGRKWIQAVSLRRIIDRTLVDFTPS